MKTRLSVWIIFISLLVWFNQNAYILADDNLETEVSIMKSGKQVIADSLVITVIYDNNPFVNELEPAWGFSCVIEGADKTLLFDTGGDNDIFMSNLKKMNIKPDDIDMVMISHDHWDHAGGLEAFLKADSRANVHVLGQFSNKVKDIVREYSAQMIEHERPANLYGPFFTTGSMATNRQGLYEQALVISTDRGLIIITGCAHPGIINIVEETERLFDQKILFVMGGFHLVESTESEISTIIEKLQLTGIDYIAPCHCTGETARKMFKDSFKDKFINIGAGKIISIRDLK